MADEKEVIEQTAAPEEIQYAKLPEPLIFRYLRERETAPSEAGSFMSLPQSGAASFLF